MKKVYSIKVVIDEDAEPQASHCLSNPDEPGKFEVLIFPSGMGISMADGLAHELGHVVAEIFETEACENDPRTIAAKGAYAGKQRMVWDIFGPEPGERERMTAAEREAWEFAGKMRNIDVKMRDLALESYATGKCPCQKCRERREAREFVERGGTREVAA